MKKYLTLAAVLGAIAFISVSYLAQAEEKMMAPAAVAAPAAEAPAAAPAASYAADNDTCGMLSSAPTTEGSAPSADAKDAAFKKCMMGKGHTEEELKKAAEAEKKAAEGKAPAAEAAPAAAPAAK